MKRKIVAALLSFVLLLEPVAAVQASGTVIEAEDTVTDMSSVKPEHPGDYTGEGYLEATDEASKVEFTINADQPGNYAVETRYSNGGAREQSVSVYVNDKFIKEEQLPVTINGDTYASLTTSLPLQQGENKIRFQMGGRTGTESISTGPLYWMAYETPFEEDHYLEEDRWDKNVEWMAEQGFVDAGYKMMSTDGWIEGAQVIDENGYITKYNYSWNKTWKGMGDQLKAKGMTLGVYYDPLWVTAAAYNSDATIIGTEIPVSSLVNPEFGQFSDFKPVNLPQGEGFDNQEWCQDKQPALYWLDTNQEGAEQYIKGYVKHFAEAGATFLRVDFLGWYENGIGGDNKQNGKPAYGTARYEKALRWMREACDENGMLLSLVMPNQYNHAEVELKYGDMMRVNEDVSNGGWDNPTNGPEKGWPNNHISGRRRGQWQPDWAQWGNSFDAFTGWADVGGRGQMILDGDFLRMARFDVVRETSDSERKLTAEEAVTADAQKRSAVSLAAMAGSPICIADQYDTMNANAPAGVDNKYYYLNQEILDLNKSGFVAKPMGLGESERWAGQLADGSWVVALFNRDREVTNQTINFKEDLGITGTASVRELWKHKNYGRMDSFSVDLAACDCVVLKITPDIVRYEAEAASLRDGAKSNKNHGNFSGWGFADKLEKGTGDVLFAVQAQGAQNIQIRYCNGSETDVPVAAVYVNGTKLQDVSLPSTGNWDTWGTVTVENAVFQDGENLVNLKCTGKAGFNLDYIELGTTGPQPDKKTVIVCEAEEAERGAGAEVASNHQLAYDNKFVASLEQPHWAGSNDTLKFRFEVEEEGDYDLSFRYANGKEEATADIFVNDKKLGYFTFPTVYPDAWDTWGMVTLFEGEKDGENVELEKVHLTAGVNTVEYKHGNGAVNLDRLTVTPHKEQIPVRVVESVEAFTGIRVKAGTAFNALGLPAKAKVNIKGETEPILTDVVWNPADLDLNTPGEYILSGELQLGAGISNDKAVEITVTVEQAEEKPGGDGNGGNDGNGGDDGNGGGDGSGGANVQNQKKIVSIRSLTEIKAAKGTAFEKLLLPKTVIAELANKSTAVLEVTWSKNGYDPQKTGTCTLNGEVKLKDGVTNPDGRKAQIRVTLQEESQQNSSASVKKGKVYTVGSYKYKVMDTSKKTVAISGSKKKSMKKIVVPSTIKLKGKTYKVTAIGASAFKNCKKATSVKVGKNVTSIGNNAFYGCVKVKTVTLYSKKLKTIGSKAFYNCKKLTKVTIKSTVLKKVGSKAFTKTSKKITIKVPKKKKTAYKKLLKKKGLSKQAKFTS